LIIIENKKDKANQHKKMDFESGNRYTIKKILAPYNVCSKAISSTRYTKMMWFSRHLILPKNNKKIK